MINAKDKKKNSENSNKCVFCESDDTAEHLFECPILRGLTQGEIKAINLEIVDNMQELR